MSKLHVINVDAKRTGYVFYRALSMHAAFTIVFSLINSDIIIEFYKTILWSKVSYVLFCGAIIILFQ